MLKPLKSLLAKEVLVAQLFLKYNVVEAYSVEDFKLSDKYANLIILCPHHFDYMYFYKQLLVYFPLGVKLQLITDPLANCIKDRQPIFSNGEWLASCSA